LFFYYYADADLKKSFTKQTESRSRWLRARLIVQSRESCTTTTTAGTTKANAKQTTN